MSNLLNILEEDVDTASIKADETDESNIPSIGNQPLTLPLIMKLPAGFFDRYWDYVDACMEWIYGELAGTQLSNTIGAGRDAGYGTDLYKNAENAIKSEVFRYMNSNSHSASLEPSVIQQLVVFQMLGLGILEPIWRDKKVEELFVDGPKHINMIYSGREIRIPAASFKDPQHVYAVIDKILKESNRKDLELSPTRPYLDARLKDLSRVAALHTDVVPGGPIVDIRRHPTNYWTITDMVRNKTCNKEIMQDLAKWIDAKMSILVIGETGSGKTSFLDAMSGLFPNGTRIWTIEDVLELELNPNKPFKVPGTEVKLPNKENQNGFSIRDHVRASLRMMPGIVVIGETRDKSAYDLMDAANTGHQVFSTLHANSPDDAIIRLMNLISTGGDIKGKEALGMIATAFDIIIYIDLDKQDFHRRVLEIAEVGSRPTAESFTDANGTTIYGEETVPTKPIWEFQQTGINDNGEVEGDWVKVGEISDLLAKRKRLAFAHDFSWEDCLKLEGFVGKSTHIEHEELES